MKNIILFLIVFTGWVNAYTQSIKMFDMGDGEHHFRSTHSESDLHFFLFGDGHYSHDPNPVHIYEAYTGTIEALFYTVAAYDDNDVDERIVDNPGPGTPNPDRVNLDFENKIASLESWNLVKGQDNFFILMFENTEAAQSISGCVEWHYNINELDVNENEILDNYDNNWVSNRQIQSSDYTNEGFTHKIVWDYSNLEVDEQRFVYIPAICLQNQMQRVKTRTVMKKDSCSFIPYDPNNDGNDPNITSAPYHTLFSTVRKYPRDPNCIVPDPYALSLLDMMQKVNYRIYFQNEGNDFAQNVLVEYSIYAPVHSSSYIQSSDNCIADQISPQKWNIYFPNINLPGIEQTPSPAYEETVGWIDFEVCYDLAQFIQSYSLSEADIRFDAQPVFSAQNTMYRLLDAPPPASDCDINFSSFSNNETLADDSMVYPNPSTDHITVVPPDNAEYYSMTLLDLSGKEVHRAEKVFGSHVISMAAFPSGAYFLNMVYQGKAYTHYIAHLGNE